MRVTFNELAERELNDAAEYYELERPGLGSVFIAEVQRCTEGIVAHPQAAPAVRGGFGVACVNAFRMVCCTRS